MKTLNAYIKTDYSFTAVIDGVPKTISNAHPSFDSVMDAVNDGNIDLLHTLLDVKEVIRNKFNSTKVGGMQITDDGIYYDGQLIHNYVVDRIFDFMAQDLPFKPLVNFLEKLMENPSRRAVNELYKFLEHKNMPICPDGDFLAYKSVRADYKDHHTGQFSNHVGAILSMTRNQVCDNAEIGCSEGFHAGSYEYASTFGSGNCRMVIVKINPADVVSVPNDCNCQKLRTARYEVVKDFDVVYREPLNTEFGYDDEDYDDYGYDEDEEEEVPVNKYHSVRDSKGRFMKAV
jgi:hypothetical protein